MTSEINSVPSPHQFGFGWIRDQPDMRDIAYSAPFIISRTLPEKVDLRSQCPPVVYQENINSCTANAIASAHHFDQIKQGAKDAFQPSRLFIYYNARKIEGNIYNDNGAQIRNGFKSIANDGVCREESWLYITTFVYEEPTEEAIAEALDHQALVYMKVQQTLGQLKGCLADGYPFVFGFSVYSSFMTEVVEQTGMVPFPSNVDSWSGGHAVMAVGYDDATQRFIVQNSWGTNWGDNGFFYMPYSYLTDINLAADFWTVRTVEI